MHMYDINKPYIHTKVSCALCGAIALVLPVCVLHIKPFLSTRRHPAHPAPALILHRREIQALWSQNYDTGSYVVDSNSVMPCHCAGLWQAPHTYASYPDILKERNKSQRNTMIWHLVARLANRSVCHALRLDYVFSSVFTYIRRYWRNLKRNRTEPWTS